MQLNRIQYMIALTQTLEICDSFFASDLKVEDRNKQKHDIIEYKYNKYPNNRIQLSSYYNTIFSLILRTKIKELRENASKNE